MLINGGNLIATVKDNGMTDVEGICTMCKEKFTVVARTEGIAHWLGGELIQKALGDLSAGDREFLVTQICDGCFNKLFPDDEE